MAYKTHIVCHSRSQSHLQEEVCSIQHKEMGSSIRECKRSSYNEHLVPPPSLPPPPARTVALPYLNDKVID